MCVCVAWHPLLMIAMMRLYRHMRRMPETSVISQALNKVNPLYATILGQPFEGQEIDMSLDRWVLNITASGRSCGGSRAPPPPP